MLVSCQPLLAHKPRGPAFLQGTGFPLLAGPPPPAAAALATRTTNDVVEIVDAIVESDFLVWLDVTQRPDEHAAAIGVGLCVRVTGMIDVARDIAARRPVDGDATIDFAEVAVATPFKPAGFLITDARAFIFNDFLAGLDRS